MRVAILRWVLYVLVILLCISSARAGEVSTDHSEFIRKVRSDENIGILVFTSPYCAPCKAYKSELYKNLPILEKQNITLGILDTTVEENKPYVKFYQKAFDWKGEIPATVVVTKDGRKGLGLKTGRMTISELLSWISTCFERAKNVSE